MYSGQLTFEDGDPLDVRSFIIRENEIAFELIGAWGSHGMWKRSGVAPKGSIGFSSDFQPSFHEQTGVEGYRCRIAFRTINFGATTVDVTGAWIEKGESRNFSGSLRKRANTALVADAYSSPLRARRGTAKRGR
jgi:hypothetical protein